MGPRTKAASDLAPDRLAEVDLIGVGERAGTGADRAADQRTRGRVPEQRAADRAGASAHGAAADGAIRGAGAARAEREKRQRQGGGEGDPFHGFSPERRARAPSAHAGGGQISRPNFPNEAGLNERSPRS